MAPKRPPSKSRCQGVAHTRAPVAVHQALNLLREVRDVDVERLLTLLQGRLAGRKRSSPNPSVRCNEWSKATELKKFACVRPSALKRFTFSWLWPRKLRNLLLHRAASFSAKAPPSVNSCCPHYFITWNLQGRDSAGPNPIFSDFQNFHFCVPIVFLSPENDQSDFQK